MDYKKILTIQDISCVGQCSLTVALPVISACGHETAILPSAVLSTHTGGFKGFTFRDLTEDIPGIQAQWIREGIRFDAIYTGYLGSMRQIEYVKDILSSMGKESAVKIVDPAMADNGVLYSNFDEEYVKAMIPLCRMADIVIPNITEACFLTGYRYQEKYDQAYVDGLLKALIDLGIRNVVLTGVSFNEETTGIVVCENGKTSYYRHTKLARSSHGTGDVFASAFVGAYLRGKSMVEAAGIAGDFVLDCMLNTQDDKEHWYGVKFEPVLGELIKRLK